MGRPPFHYHISYYTPRSRDLIVETWHDRGQAYRRYDALKRDANRGHIQRLLRIESCGRHWCHTKSGWIVPERAMPLWRRCRAAGPAQSEQFKRI
jgi:hypothetical protein